MPRRRRVRARLRPGDIPRGPECSEATGYSTWLVARGTGFSIVQLEVTAPKKTSPAWPTTAAASWRQSSPGCGAPRCGRRARVALCRQECHDRTDLPVDWRGRAVHREPQQVSLCSGWVGAGRMRYTASEPKERYLRQTGRASPGPRPFSPPRNTAPTGCRDPKASSLSPPQVDVELGVRSELPCLRGVHIDSPVPVLHPAARSYGTKR